MKISLKEMIVAQIGGGFILLVWTFFMINYTAYLSNKVAILVLSFIVGFFIVLSSLLIAKIIFDKED